jgi:hypothetical protein
VFMSARSDWTFSSSTAGSNDLSANIARAFPSHSERHKNRGRTHTRGNVVLWPCSLPVLGWVIGCGPAHIVAAGGIRLKPSVLLSFLRRRLPRSAAHGRRRAGGNKRHDGYADGGFAQTPRMDEKRIKYGLHHWRACIATPHTSVSGRSGEQARC